VRVLLPPDLRDDAARLAVVPSDAAAARLATNVLDRVSGFGSTRVEVVVRRMVLRQDSGLRLRLEPLATGVAS
jgi:hypothetical protein